MIALKARPTGVDELTMFNPAYDRVLVVDDIAPIRRAMSRMVLNTVGAQLVEEMPDGTQALRQLITAHEEGQPFDLLISDIAMPGPTGPGLIRALGEAGVPTPVVFCSGRQDCPTLGALRALGFCVLLKPFSAADLARALVSRPMSALDIADLDAVLVPGCRGPEREGSAAHCLTYCGLAAKGAAEAATIAPSEPLCSPKIGGVPISTLPLFDDFL